MEKIIPITSVLGISIDSSEERSSIIIGRSDKNGKTLSNKRALEICHFFRNESKNGLLKINTVVTKKNHLDDFGNLISMIQPDKWKILKTLGVYLNAAEITPTDEEFLSYIERHSNHSEIISVEDNSDMYQSYLMINPSGCFYQNKICGFGYDYSQPILDVGVDKAIKEIGFNAISFKKRYLGKKL